MNTAYDIALECCKLHQIGQVGYDIENTPIDWNKSFRYQLQVKLWNYHNIYAEWKCDSDGMYLSLSWDDTITLQKQIISIGGTDIGVRYSCFNVLLEFDESIPDDRIDNYIDEWKKKDNQTKQRDGFYRW
jgi:hypothetical protein